MKNNKKLAVALFAIGLTSSMSAIAGPLLTTTETEAFNFTTLDASQVLTFDGFDATKGTLNSVHLTWAMSKTLKNDIINTLQTASPSTTQIGNPFPVFATSTTTFTGNGLAIALSDINNLSTPGFVGAIPTPVIPNSFEVTTVGTATAPNLMGLVCISNDNSCGVGNTNLAGYIGGINLFTVTIANAGTQSGSVPTGVFGGNSGNANGTVSIQYDYSERTPPPAPEPTSMAFMGLGLAGLAAFRRRKRS